MTTTPPLANLSATALGTGDRFSTAGFQLLIFDKNNNLMDVPSDAVQGQLALAVNGGASDGTITFAREYNDIGAIGEGYRFQFFLPGDTDPWWDGRIVEIDQKQLRASGQVIATLEGWHTYLNEALCDFYLSPGTQPNGQNNGQMDYADLMNWLVPYYKPTDVTWETMTATGVNVQTLQVSQQGLSDVIDVVVKSVLDNNGRNYEWYCDGKADLSKVVYSQPVQFDASTALFAVNPGDIANWDVRTIYKNIQNMLVIMGGQDNMGNTVWGPFQDAQSISDYGLRQGFLQNNYLVSDSQLQQYASAQLAVKAYPQYQGSFTVVRPSALWRAGKWVQIVASPNLNVSYTFRLGKVTVTWGKANMIKMVCEPSAPIPRIDQVLFDTSNQTRVNAARPSLTPSGAASLANDTAVISGGALE